jgi:hypothetical protein
MYKNYITLGLFLILIINFGQYSYLLATTFIVSLLFFLKKHKSIILQKQLISISIFLLFFWYSYFSLYALLDFKIYFTVTLYVFTIILFWIFIDSIKVKYIHKSIKSILLLLLLIVLIQHIFYIVTKHYFDIHYIITLGGYFSRVDGALINSYGLTRVSGISIEPSNFSAMISYLTILYYLLKQKLDKVIYLGFLASFLTFSYAGIVINTILFMLLYIKNNKINVKLISLFLIILYVVSSILIDRLFSNVEYDLITSRMYIFQVFNNSSWVQFLFGNGMLAFEFPITINDTIITNSNIRDTGIWINLLFSSGVVGIILLLLYIHANLKSKFELILIIILFNYKLDYLQPIFWFFLLGLPYVSKQKTKQK